MASIWSSFSKKSRRAIALSILALSLIAWVIGYYKNSSELGNDSDSLSESAFQNPEEELPDSLRLTPVPPLPDTSHLSLYAIDSIKMHRAFWQAANDISTAFNRRQAEAYAAFAPPGMVDRFGGRSAYLNAVRELLASPNIPNRVQPLAPLRVAAALDDEGYGHGWYALIPVRQRFADEVQIQWLGAQTLDEGQQIYIIDISSASKEKIEQIMPDLLVALETSEMEDLRLSSPETWPKP
jgi:hypothetical protein